MITLSKEELKELDEELSQYNGQNERTILKYLAEVYHKNLQNPGVTMKTLEAQIGGDTAWADTTLAVQHLWELKLIGYPSRNMVAISQQGLAYVNFNKGQYIVSHKRPSRKLLWGIIIPLIITIVGGVIVALITGWRPW